MNGLLLLIICCAALLAGYRRLARRVKEQEEERKAIKAGLLAILHDRLYAECSRCLAQGSIDTDAIRHLEYRHLSLRQFRKLFGYHVPCHSLHVLSLYTFPNPTDRQKTRKPSFA